MRTAIHRAVFVAAVLGALVPAATSNAQVEQLLKQGQSSGMGKLGGLGGVLPGAGVASGSPGNIVGLLEFCIKNNFLGGKESSSVKDQLMGKLGGTPSTDTGYLAGAQGLLKSSDGKQVDLSGGGIQAQVSKQVCDQVLRQAKSLL
ncbi:MAG TPA: DUF2501 domain-containing protein [Telluria sp.]